MAIDNFYETASALVDKSYSLTLSPTYLPSLTLGGNSSFLATVGATIKPYNFAVTWQLTPYTVANSDNISIVQSIQFLTNGQIFLLPNLYSGGATMNNESAAVGLSGFQFDSKSSLSYAVWFDTVNSEAINITTTTIPLIIPKAYVSSVVLGAPSCPGSYMINYPQATCVTCNVTGCLVCNGSLCSSCQWPRYLYVLDSSGPAGICICPTGFVDINDVCTVCNTSCSDCLNGDPNNCSACVYGYQLIESSCIKVCYLLDPNGNQCVVCPEGCSVC